MKKNIFFSFALLLAIAFSCKKNEEAQPMIAVAFVNQELNLSESITQVNIVFSSATRAAGTLTLSIEPTNAVYGTDFTTTPAISNSTISLPFEVNATNLSFSFTKLLDAKEGETKNVKFTISSVSVEGMEIAANVNYTKLNFNEVALGSNTIVAENGGNTFPDQLFIDFSSGLVSKNRRTTWDLAFYTGSAFRVAINGSVKMAVKQLATTNIDEVQSTDPNVAVGTYTIGDTLYVDRPEGNITGTAIAEVSATDADNKVYLVNLGQDIATTPATGTGAALTGASRGWKKIRILRNGDAYKLQYADLEQTTHQEVTISKDASYNFTFFSLATNATVSVEPTKQKWDISLSTFTNFTLYGTDNVTYFYPDFVVSNSKAGTRAYQVLTSEVAYDDFTFSNVVGANFETNTAKDQRTIGANWRATFPSPAIKTDRFYVLRDVAGNVYKVRFNGMLNSSSQRGTVTFEYKKLN
ncbi:MAG: HmuY family protein [Thermonemataceae bacterium]|nr:HmuY family protein [Thermonemataceae bacterium]